MSEGTVKKKATDNTIPLIWMALLLLLFKLIVKNTA